MDIRNVIVDFSVKRNRLVTLMMVAFTTVSGSLIPLIKVDTDPKQIASLEKVYASLVPSKNSPVIVHCRTGHQASQTLFVLKRLLGYNNVAWYDAGWSEWAARPELPVETR